MGADPSNGRVKARWLANPPACAPDLIYDDRDELDQEDQQPTAFDTAYRAALSGEPLALAEVICSRYELNVLERSLIADLLLAHVRTPPRKRRGRPSKFMLRTVARTAIAFYREWRADNRAQGIRDWGNAADMKTESARFVIEELEPRLAQSLSDDDRERVRDIMDRPALWK